MKNRPDLASLALAARTCLDKIEAELTVSKGTHLLFRSKGDPFTEADERLAALSAQANEAVQALLTALESTPSE